MVSILLKWTQEEGNGFKLHSRFLTFFLHVNFMAFWHLECAEQSTSFFFLWFGNSKQNLVRRLIHHRKMVKVENYVIFSFDTSLRVFPCQLLNAWPTRGREENQTKLTWVATKNTHPKKEGGEKEVGAEGRGWMERYHTSERGRRLEKAGGRERERERLNENEQRKEWKQVKGRRGSRRKKERRQAVVYCSFWPTMWHPVRGTDPK